MPVSGSGGWHADELSLIDGSGEVDIATRRGDGTLRAARIVWIVRHGDAVYIRSVNGATAAWRTGRGPGCRLPGQVRPLVRRRRPYHRGRRPRVDPARRPR